MNTLALQARHDLQPHPKTDRDLHGGIAAVVAVQLDRFRRIERRLRHEPRPSAVMWLCGVDEERMTEVNGAGLACRQRERPICGCL